MDKMSEFLKKFDLYKVLYVIALIGVLSFLALVGWDYMKFDPAVGTPFYMKVLNRVIYYLLPSCIIFFATTILQSWDKNEKKKQKEQQMKATPAGKGSRKKKKKR